MVRMTTNSIPGKWKLHSEMLLYFLLLFSLPQLLAANEGEVDKSKNGSGHEDIRMVMSAAFVSELGVDVYNDIANYLGEKLSHKVSFVTGFSYSTINSMFDSGIADIGFICGLPYVMKHDEPQSNVELLLAPVMKDKKYKDKPEYYSYVIVHKDSKVKNFAALKGSRFVFNDEISNSGYNMPRAHLIDMGGNIRLLWGSA